MNIKVECHEANHICDKNQYKEATFWEKVKLNFHLIYCRACRKYSARNNKLTKAIKNPKVQTVSMSEKEAMKRRLEEQLSN
ncbi:hypothetical protein EAX61_12010 [Dokdonia sinensis]|uniref:Glycine dehydrogenase n=1 Tax=Dokdonia sinensis TaxID=2479847 RepID=A0A3M0FWN9_9FLAO|nr:hypothetical protein [Dokdonia sinensis]RMB57091.1 hypothetical protein EAX61_12010 [Dokdonia sinensis]